MEASASPQLFTYHFKVGMTCDGCKNAITKLLGTEEYVKSFETAVKDQRVYVVGPEGIEDQVIQRLSKWATASKKQLEYLHKEELVN